MRQCGEGIWETENCPFTKTHNQESPVRSAVSRTENPFSTLTHEWAGSRTSKKLSKPSLRKPLKPFEVVRILEAGQWSLRHLATICMTLRCCPTFLGASNAFKTPNEITTWVLQWVLLQGCSRFLKEGFQAPVQSNGRCASPRPSRWIENFLRCRLGPI